jgi:hypothetical protein
MRFDLALRDVDYCETRFEVSPGTVSQIRAPFVGRPGCVPSVDAVIVWAIIVWAIIVWAVIVWAVIVRWRRSLSSVELAVAWAVILGSNGLGRRGRRAATSEGKDEASEYQGIVLRGSISSIEEL